MYTLIMRLFSGASSLHDRWPHRSRARQQAVGRDPDNRSLTVAAPIRAFIGVALFVAAASAQEIPAQDARNSEIRHRDMHFEMPQYEDLEAWKQRAEFLKKQILSSAGLYPLPPKTPLKPQVFDKIEYGDYTIEKVLLETYPGFFLGGNLYRPAGKQGPFPAVVSPHGHWRYGRFENQPLNSIPLRGINLAKQGHVAFTYDMVGYSDTMQIPHATMGSERERVWGVELLGVHLWDSIRAVDFVLSLDGVDPTRVATTGASGGGTQAFLLAAVDERVRFSAPVNMVSAIMQGGSPCENAPNLRIDTFNVELASLIAPRPMLLVSATGDWTKNVPKEEFPAIQKIYELYDAKSEVEVVQFDSPHNYHKDSREAVYRFFGKRILHDPDPEHFAEENERVGQLSSLMSLWGRSLPERAVTYTQFVEDRIREAELDVSSLKPSDPASLAKAQAAFRERLELSLLASLPAPDDLLEEVIDTWEGGRKLVIGRAGKGDRLPAVVLSPKRPVATVRPTIIVHEEGSAWVMSSAESRDGLVAALLSGGGSVIGIDVFQTAHAERQRQLLELGEVAERYYTVFNRTDDANRVQDVLTAIAYARKSFGTEHVNLVGMGRAGSWALLGRALTDGPVDLFADLKGVEASDEYIARHFFVPGFRRAGDFRAAATLLPGGSALLWNVGEAFPAEWLQRSFEHTESSGLMQILEERASAELLVDHIAPPTSRRNRRR